MPLARDDIAHLVETLEYLQEETSRQAETFAEVEAFCLFVGYPKSGHSLIGALLDAHPDMVIAHELDCLRCLRAGLSRELIFALILELAADFHGTGHAWNGYRYRVANQWQGRFRRLKVLGDKKGGGSSRLLWLYPKLLDRLRATLDLPIKFIHVVRHPLHNISSIGRDFGVSLEEAMDLYVSMAESVSRLKSRWPAENLFEIRYETFAEQPAAHLADLCRFLGQAAPADYLDDCAALVRPAAPSPRGFSPWPAGLMLQARRKIERFEFLGGYSLD